MHESISIVPVLKLAAWSRVVIFGLQVRYPVRHLSSIPSLRYSTLLQILFNLLPDHKADAFNPNAVMESTGLVDQAVGNLLDGFHKWDAKYFIFIAKNGYTKEQMYAFFPMYPMALRMLATILHVIHMPISCQTNLLLSGAFFNLLLFVGSVRALYCLTLRIFGDEKFAIMTAVTYCFNPASIFFSSNYTESLYAFCVFQALDFMQNGSEIKSMVLFMFASATRSNGIVNIGFPVYHRVLRQLFNREKGITLSNCFKTTFIILGILLPFALFNYIGYNQFCTDTKYLSEGSDWCTAKFPLIYSYIQSAHWNLGFLKYYRIRKIPNILLALPCLALNFYGVYRYVANSRNPRHCNSLSQFANMYCMLEYVVHALFLCSFGIAFMHVEVVTRFLYSSSPFPSWVAAAILLNDCDKFSVPFPVTVRAIPMFWKTLCSSSKLICVYYATYCVVGTFLHVNFLPWT